MLCVQRACRNLSLSNFDLNDDDDDIDDGYKNAHNAVFAARLRKFVQAANVAAEAGFGLQVPVQLHRHLPRAAACSPDSSSRFRSLYDQA